MKDRIFEQLSCKDCPGPLGGKLGIIVLTPLALGLIVLGLGLPLVALGRSWGRAIALGSGGVAIATGVFIVSVRFPQSTRPYMEPLVVALLAGSSTLLARGPRAWVVVIVGAAGVILGSLPIDRGGLLFGQVLFGYEEPELWSALPMVVIVGAIQTGIASTRTRVRVGAQR